MSQGFTLFLGIFLILLLAAVLVLLIYWQGLSNAVFIYCFKRGSEERWMRGSCSCPSDKNLYQMWEDGLDWAAENKAFLTELETMNDGVHLAAQYFDFGNDRAVILVPGMYETCMYSYYYAEVYRQAGYNCLLIDNRTTGNSGGEYNSIGYNESGDLIKWTELLNAKHNNRRIVIHGISMGAVSGLLALNFPNCPAFLSGIICDEAYYRFTDFFRNYMVSKRYNLIAYKTVLKKIRRICGTNPEVVAPVSFIDRINVPVLFLAGRNDNLISREETQEMFDKCGTACGNQNKKLVWFENGTHGFLRYCDKEAYDDAVRTFLDTL